MVVTINEQLSSGFSSVENTRSSTARILNQIKLFQDNIRKHIDDNYVSFLPNTTTTSDIYIDEGEGLLREVEYLITNIGGENALIAEAKGDVEHSLNELVEANLALKLSHRILNIDDLFKKLDESNSKKEYLEVFNLLGKLKGLICSESSSDTTDRLLQQCECYDTIKVKFHIQSTVLQQNLQQQFDSLVKFTEKKFPSATNIMVQVSKDQDQLQNTVTSLFQARYNPMKLCKFLLDNCLYPMILKPVSVEYSTENEKYLQLNISYSTNNANNGLRPSYKLVFAHIKSLLDCLGNINVKVSTNQHVFALIGNHVKEPFLKCLVEECLMHAVPETMDEYQESTLVNDIIQFERNVLAAVHFIDPETDKHLSKFVTAYDSLFQQRFSSKVLETVRVVMQKDLQDMTAVGEENVAEECDKNLLFPKCMISKSTLELTTLMDRILRQPLNLSENDGINEQTTLLSVIPLILNTYCADIPIVHRKLLESIPQQSALFYNNCMFLAHWLAKKVELNIPTYAALVKTLQAKGKSTLKVQEAQQLHIISEILKDLDISDIHSIGSSPSKLLRQCFRQMDLLKNVWQNVLPDCMYKRIFFNMLDDFCQDIIKRVIRLEDISTTVANELVEFIDIILEKSPLLFKEKHEVYKVPCWMKLQQLKLILNATLLEITEQWCDGAGILTANYKAEDVRHLIRALFQNTDRRAKALSRIV